MATIPVVNTIDKRKGIVTSIFTLLLLLFYLMWATLEKADPPPQDPIVMTETIMPEEIDLKNFVVDGGAAAGSPTDDVVKPPTPQTEKVLTTNKPSNTSTPTGQSNHTNANNSNNTSSTSQASNNPFGSGGSNGSNGPGGTFQGSNGPGVDGYGGGTERKRQNDLELDHLDFSEHAIVSLIL